MYMENCSKHEAILKAKEMIGGATRPMDQLTRSAVLTKMFTYFKNAISNSKPAKEYIASRCLDHNKTEIGYNSGQFHHGQRKNPDLIKSCIKYGILLDLGTKSRTGNKAYKPFGKWCIVFALRNPQNQIVSLYFRSTLDKKNQRHFYLRDRQGLYPNYPKPSTRRLILTESIIDAATLLEQEQIKSQYEILSLYGTNGLTEEHTEAVSQLKELEEIIFFLNGDAAGNKAVQKYAPMLKGEYPNIKISNVQVPENEDVNSLLEGHSPEILSHLIETRKLYDYVPAGSQVLFSSGEASQRVESGNPDRQTNETTEVTQKEEVKVNSRPVLTGLDTSTPYNLKYATTTAKYQIKGFRISQPDSLKITLQITTR